MPPPPIEGILAPPDRRWAAAARLEGRRLLYASAALRTVHHIGSTAIEGLVAKPIIDLLGVASDLSRLDEERAVFESLGYSWRGENGLPGRRYCKLSEAAAEHRVHLHCYAEGDASIERHLAFRDYLRAHPEVAAAYQDEKLRCASLTPADSHAYAECKSQWIRSVEQEALQLR